MNMVKNPNLARRFVRGSLIAAGAALLLASCNTSAPESDDWSDEELHGAPSIPVEGHTQVVIPKKAADAVIVLATRD